MKQEKQMTKKVLIPKDRINKADVMVSINDQNWLIKRGVEVEVPLEVAEVLEQQQDALDRVDAYNAENAK